MQAIINWLSGRKTIIGTVALGVIGVLASAGLFSLSNVYVQIVTILIGVWTGVSFRLAQNKRPVH